LDIRSPPSILRIIRFVTSYSFLLSYWLLEPQHGTAHIDDYLGVYQVTFVYNILELVCLETTLEN